MKFLFCSVFVFVFGATLVCGKPQFPDNAAIIVSASDGAIADIEGTGRNFFPVDTSAADEAGFRLPVAELASEQQFGETRNPRLIGGPAPEEKNEEDDIGIIIVGNGESNTGEERVLPLDEGRRSPLVVDFEIIGASSQDEDEEEIEDFVIIQAVYEECFEDLDAGNGELAVDSYYYDSNENRCLFFWYAGSGGNGNRFSTEEECEKRCRTNSVGSSNKVCSTAAPICKEGCLLIKDASDSCLRCSCDGVNPEVCKEAGGQPGICKGTFPYWYFKEETQTCEPFVYGGCEAGSSSNKFKTKALCQKTCFKPQGSVVQEVVVSPKNLELSAQNNERSNKSNICSEEGGKHGLCNGALTYWYFKQDTQTCESFIYGGCEAGSSQNKFVTRELCVQTCNLF